MKYTVEDIWELFPNKYEAIIVVAKEARRIAQQARETETRLDRKATILAIEKLLRGEIQYTREDE